MSDEPSTREAGGEKKNAKREKKHENNPCTLPTRDKEKNSGLTSVRVRINESGLLVRSIVVRGSLTISMKCLRHESMRSHVQCVYRITAVPISWSLGVRNDVNTGEMM